VKSYSFFIAGIIQGSIAHEAVYCQDYRREMKEIIQNNVPSARVYCPVENHPESLKYDDSKAFRVFFDHIKMVEDTDCLVTYLPEASMGTAVEMYAARKAGRAVVTVSPLAANWAIKFLSDRVLPDMNAFREFARSGELAEFLEEFYGPERSSNEPG
jgi:hypothetical protein